MKIYTAISAAVLLSLGATAHATVMVPGGGNTGLKSFSYSFDADCAGCSISIGVSDVGDSAASPTQMNTNFGGILTGTGDFLLDANADEDTSAYLNFFGAAGVAGDIETIAFDALVGESLSFDWQYQSNDGGSFNDFSFVSINDANGGELYYDVLAQDVEQPVAEPGILLLMGLGLGLMGLRRRV